MTCARSGLGVRHGLWIGLPMALLLATPTLWGEANTNDASGLSVSNAPTVILVMGAAGDAEYGGNFVHHVELWRQTVERAPACCVVVGGTEPQSITDREVLQQVLESQPRETSQPLWVVLIGHGTFDGENARFNLRGPDVSAEELAQWLQPFSRPLVILNTASASAPFIHALSATNREVVTATRSGDEQNFARFGGQLAKAIGDLESDLDQDEQVSLLEAFVSASGWVDEYYKTEGRLATEHALLDDNGDGKGTPADWFRGVHAVKSPKDEAAVDGARARQLHLVLSPAEQALSPEVRAKRNALELQIASLREKKKSMDETVYYAQLETLLLQLAHLYHTNAASAAPRSTN